MKQAFEIPEFKYNSEELKQVYLNNTSEWAKYGSKPELTLYTQYVSLENPVILKHIEQIKNYKEVIENVKFFKTLVNAGVGPHRDKRNVAINIPVIVDEHSYVAFYEKSEIIPSVLTIKDEVKQSTAKYYRNSEPIEKFKAQGTFCLDTSTIHGVINESTTDRVILSLSFKDKYNDYNTVKKMYENGELL